MLIDLTNISRRSRASLPYLQLSRRPLTSFPKASLSLREVVCSDAGGGPSFKISFACVCWWSAFVAFVTSTVARVLLSGFAPIVAVFGHLCVWLFNDYTKINLSGFMALLNENHFET